MREPREGYEDVFPNAGYAPWLTDLEFQAAYNEIKGNTLVDIYRCYELWTLSRQTLKRVGGCVVEVGVYRGGTAALLGLATCHLNRTLYACDTFQGVAKAGENDWWYKGGEFSDTSMEYVQQFINVFDLSAVRLIRGIFPEGVPPFDLPSGKIAFAHVDVDTYLSAKDTTEWIWNRLNPGGCVVFDDYGFRSTSGVTKFVNEFAHDNNTCSLIHNLNGHGILTRLW